MARYRMDDGTVLDTANATQSWYESTYWDGNNRISVATGAQCAHQTLYRSRRGRYYLECTSQWQNHAEWISNRSAASWLLVNHREIPDDLKEEAEQVSE